jgi:hypothetical protein
MQKSRRIFPCLPGAEWRAAREMETSPRMESCPDNMNWLCVDVVQGRHQNEDDLRRYEERITSIALMRSGTVTVEVRRIPSEKE